MNVTVNKSTLALMFDDIKSNEDIIEFLNQVIDEEFEKQEPDCDLIDECINAIDELSSTTRQTSMLHIALTPQSIIKLVNPKRKSFKQLNKALRIAIVAAVIATGTFTVNAAVQSATGVDLLGQITNVVEQIFKNDKDDNNEINQTNKSNNKNDKTGILTENDKAEPVSEQTVASAVNNDYDSDNSQIKQLPVFAAAKPIITQPSESYAPSPSKDNNNIRNDEQNDKYLVGVHAVYTNMNRNLLLNEKLSYDGMNVYAVYSDGTEEEVPLSQCTYPTAFDSGRVGDYTLNLQYMDTIISFGVTVRPDEETRLSEICSNDTYEYLLASKGAYITEYKGSSNQISVDEIDSHSVYAVLPKVFADSDLVSFYSSSVVKIYESAFENSQKLKICYIPNAKYFDDSAFSNCENLSDLTINDEIGTLGEYTFQKVPLQNVVLSPDITSVPDFAFNECQELTSVTFKGKVDKIGANAFSECISLESVTGTEDIKEVGEFAFFSCEFMEFDSVIPNLSKVDACAFSFCKSLYLGDLNNLVYIGEQAFKNCTHIDSVVISSKIKTVPQAAFQGAVIQNIIFDEGVTKVEDFAFMSTAITSLTLPDSLEYIGSYAFYTNRLSKVYGGNNVNYIGSNAFYPSKRLVVYAEKENVLTKYAKENNLKYNIL